MGRNLGIAALAGAGLGFLFFTDKGREFQGRAKQFAMDQYARVDETIHNGRFWKTMRDAVEKPHPDTPMAQAFEESVAAQAG